MTGYIVFAHGSSLQSANDAVRKVARDAAGRAGWAVYETAFLEGIDTRLAPAIDKLASLGVKRVVIVPYFLTLGAHLKRDLPALVEQMRAVHPELEFDVRGPLDGHPAMVEALVDRARADPEEERG